jgi:glycosyltransferase involved in cell wall biosynthesis
MRILWLGNAPFVPSGYGEQAALFIPRLQQQGHDLAVACNYGVSSVRLDWNGLTVYPDDHDWGNRALATYAEHHQADLVIALCDAWVLRPHEWPEGFTVACWAPVDHEPIPPAVYTVLAHDRVRPIAMSRFGETWMRKLGLDPCYVPHGVDTAVFQPHPGDKTAVRDELGIPSDVFLAGMVAANKGNPALPRKAFPQAFDAFARFADKHDDAFLYVHTDAQPSGGGGISLDRLATAVGCPAGRVRFPPDRTWRLGFPRDAMAYLYSAFDVLLNPSLGEGFGIPVLEAQACGVPVIASRHSAMTELAGAGWLVDGDRLWDPLQDSFWHMPSIGGICDALEDAYQRRGDPELSRKAVEFAAGYDADHVTEQFWKPALEKLAALREAPPLAMNGHAKPNRAQRRQMAKVDR